MKRKWAINAIMVLFLPLVSSCARLTVDPVEVKPIHIVMDVNIRVDRELEQFFDFEKPPAGTQPSPAPAPAGD